MSRINKGRTNGRQSQGTRTAVADHERSGVTHPRRQPALLALTPPNMKLFLIALLVVNVCSAAPQFDGVMASKGETYFALRADPSSPTKWVKLGDHVAEYALTSYDKTKETLPITAEGATIELVLKTGSVRPGETQPGQTQPAVPVFFKPTFELLKKLVNDGDLTREVEVQLLGNLERMRNGTAAKLAVLETRAGTDTKKLADLSEWRRRLQLEDDNLEHYTEQMLQAWRAQLKTGK